MSRPGVFLPPWGVGMLDECNHQQVALKTPWSPRPGQDCGGHPGRLRFRRFVVSPCRGRRRPNLGGLVSGCLNWRCGGVGFLGSASGRYSGTGTL